MAVHIDEATLRAFGPAARAAIAAAQRPAASRPPSAPAPATVANGPLLARRLLSAVQGVARAEDEATQARAVVAMMHEVAGVASILARQ